VVKDSTRDRRTVLESSRPKRLKDLSLRQITLADGQALSDLYQTSPDSGQIQIAPRYHVDAYRAVTDSRPSAVGVVAELSETGQLVGAGFVHFGQSHFEGALRPFAVLSGVVVHPDYRRRGIASQIAGWRVDCARQRLGAEGVIATAIQKQNAGSLAVAGTWSRQLVGHLGVGGVRIRQTPPAAVGGLTTHPAEPADLEAIAAGLNDCCRGNCGRSWRHRAVPDYGNAGRHIPLAMQWLNNEVRFVPADDALKQRARSRIWFAPGQKSVAQPPGRDLRWA
jgi:GNAT superfamily N-acetyltransferase